MPFARTGPIPIYYDDTGYGDPVILLHGHAADHRLWDDQVEALARARFRVIRPDLRGHGRSGAPPSGYRYEDYVTDLKALIGNLGAGPVNLVGHSLGGAIALLYTLENLRRVSSLTLVAPSLPGYTFSDEFATLVLSLRDTVRSRGPRAAIEGLYLPHPLFAGIRRQPERFDKLRSILLDFKALDYLSEEGMAEPPQVLERLSGLTPPTLIVIGDGDIDDFRLIADLLANNLPNAEKRVIADCGHIVPMEQPEELNRLLIDFLNRVRRATATPR